MFSFNRVHIIGYQTQPISVRQTPTGSSVTDLNLVVPYRFRAENGEMLDGKGFHTVTLWGPMADVAGKYARAGSQMFISGRLQTDSWDDEKTGEKRSKTPKKVSRILLQEPRVYSAASTAPMSSAMRPVIPRCALRPVVSRYSPLE